MQPGAGKFICACPSGAVWVARSGKEHLQRQSIGGQSSGMGESQSGIAILIGSIFYPVNLSKIDSLKEQASSVSVKHDHSHNDPGPSLLGPGAQA